MTRCLLVADDSSTIQKVVKIAFARFSVEILEAANLIEAYQRLNMRKPDVLVLDASLPGAKGVDDFRKLAADCGNVQVLLLVGTYESVDEALFRRQGFQYFLRKPFDSNDLVLQVEKLLGAKFSESSSSSQESVPISEESRSRVGGDQGKGQASAPSPVPPPPPARKGISEKEAKDALPLKDSFVPPPPPRDRTRSAPFTAQEDLSNQKNTPFLRQQASYGAPPPPPAVPKMRYTDGGAERGRRIDFSSESETPLVFEPRLKEVDLEEPEVASSFFLDPETPIEPRFAESEDGILNPEFAGAQIWSTEQQPGPVTDEKRRGRRAFEGSRAEEDGSMQELKEASKAQTYRFTRDHAAQDAEIMDKLKSHMEKELAPWVRQAVESYCELHFKSLAKEVIAAELRRLADEKARHLVDP